jgi:flavin reductase (DIM6/NTAB) family NADH-FMN oxidoreductase RutF
MGLVTIHSEHPFLPPDSERSPVRRLRGRLPSPVSLWTSTHQAERAGLTISSLMVADGEPGYVVGLLDPLSELWDVLSQSKTAVVNMLGWDDRQLANVFGLVAPAPGGPFAMTEWFDTEWGPALADTTVRRTWAGCQLTQMPPTEVGWAIQVQLEIRHVELGDDPQPLVHRRGAYYSF